MLFDDKNMFLLSLSLSICRVTLLLYVCMTINYILYVNATVSHTTDSHNVTSPVDQVNPSLIQ